MSPMKAILRSGRADLRPERVDSGLRGLGRDNLRPERADFRSKKADLRSERADLRPERADLMLEPVAQRQYVVSDTCCPALYD